MDTDLEPGQVQDLVKLLLATVPRFNDPPSRQAVLSVLSALLIRERTLEVSSEGQNGEAATNRKGIRGGLIKWLEMEVDKSEKLGTVAADTKFVLITWASTIFGELHSILDEAQWNSCLHSIAILLDALLDENVKPATRKAVQRIVRRLIRNVSCFDLFKSTFEPDMRDGNRIIRQFLVSSNL